MYSSTDDETVLSEQTWRAWEQKRKVREEKATRKRNLTATVILVLLAAGGAFYLFILK
jgi:hypothetical protein